MVKIVKFNRGGVKSLSYKINFFSSKNIFTTMKGGKYI